MKNKRFIMLAVAVVILLMASIASAVPDAIVVYKETDLGGSWQYDYTVYNMSTEGEALHELFFYFTGDVPLSGISLPAGWHGLPWTGMYTTSYLNAYSTEFPHDIVERAALGGFSFSVDYRSGDISYVAYFSGDKQISGTSVNCQALLFYGDADGDGYGNLADPVPACSAPAGYVPNNTDCDDTDPAIHGETLWHRDWDADGYGDPAVTVLDCYAPVLYVADYGDCDDLDATINPETLWHPDSDGDGYGDVNISAQQCTAPPGYILDGIDCDDSDPLRNPDTYWYQDNDGDGYGSMDIYIQLCSTPAGYVLVGQDCDDTDPARNPDTYWYQDNDGDSYGTYSLSLQQCLQPSAPPDYVLNKLDYNDSNSSIGPPTRINGGTPSYYLSLQQAYNTAADGDIIQCVDVTFIENLTINAGKSVTLQGGYDGSYSTITGITTLQGDMNVSDGTLNIENFELLQ